MRCLTVSVLIAVLLSCPLVCLAELPGTESAGVAVCNCESSCSLPPGSTNRSDDKNPNRDSQSEDVACLCGGAVIATTVRVTDVLAHTASVSMVDHFADVDISFDVLIAAIFDPSLHFFYCDTGRGMRVAISSFLL